VKSRRGAPKRIDTEGFACPNRQCRYFGNTDASFHALVGNGKHGRAEPIQTFRCQDCHTTFTCPAQHALVPSKNPFPAGGHGADLALAEGLDPSAASRVFGSRQTTIITWLTRAGKHAELFHEHSFRTLHLPHLQLDEIRTRLRCSTHVLWLWLVIDPHTKILPVLQLGPRTQHMAHLVIHCLRQHLAPDCLPLVTSDGLHLYFYAALGSFWAVARRTLSRQERASVAGGDQPDLRPGEKMLSTTQAA